MGDLRTLRGTALRFVFGVLAVVVLHPSSAAAQIRINPGTSIQSVVDANPPGTSFVLGAGTHRMQSIKPKDGNTFVGEPGTVLSGAKQLTNFSRTGGGTGTSNSYLSDRSWTSATSGWGPAEKDRSNGEMGAGDGRLLTLNGQTFAKGIGAHSPSDIRYSLGGGCANFAASLGVDDEEGSQGSVVFQVWADGLKLYDSGVLTNGSAVQNINVNVAGRNGLQLIVTDAGDNNYYDHADWADARLTCSGGGSGLWIATEQTQQGRRAIGGCQDYDDLQQLCLNPEQLFIDNRQLTPVGSLNQVGAGTFYFDYGADRIYFADDPTGHLVEASVTSAGFEPTANNVTVANMTLEKYATVAQVGPIDAIGRTDWVIRDNVVRWNHGSGIRAGTGTRVLRNKVTENGQMGISATGDRVLIEGNEIGYNNLAHYEIFWEGGGAKFVGTNSLTVRGNFVHHNWGPGMWTDINNLNTLYEDNTVEDNFYMGIFHEISYAAIIRNNTIRRNGFGYPAWITGAGIVVAGSPNVEVYGNLLEYNKNGIGGMQQNRGSGIYGPWILSNFWVHDNTIVMDEGWTGVVQDAGDNATFTSRNNRFERNHYKLGTNRFYFAWMNAERTDGDWRNFSQDVNGTFDR